MTQQVEMQRVEELKKDISILNTQLKQLNEQKEAKYKEKDTLDKTLNSLIKSAKELRDKKEKIDSQVKELKKTRDSLNKELKGLFDKLTGMQKQIFGSQKTQKGPKVNPAGLRKQIEAMQFAIETEGLSFEREKTYMEKIGRLKAQLEEFDKEDEKFLELKDFKAQINAKKGTADEAHSQIQKLAIESTDIFKELTAKSESIAKTKQERKTMQDVLKAAKVQIEQLNQKLADSLSEWSKLTKTSAPIAEPTSAHQQTAPMNIMGQLQSKKKLRKEDILKLQRIAIKR